MRPLSLWPLQQVAKIYISVIGEERDQEVAMEGLRAASGYVRRGLGQRMKLRAVPEVRFIRDDAMERGSRVRQKQTEDRREE